MARICIPNHEYKERVQRCATILRREKLDALIVNGNEADYANPRYFSGFWPLFERAGVAISAGGDAAGLVLRRHLNAPFQILRRKWPRQLFPDGFCVFCHTITLQ